MNKDFYRLSIEAFRHGVRAANPGTCLKEAIKKNQEILLEDTQK